ncbi:hypothetical protein [Streptomyces sundarbansensis]
MQQVDRLHAQPTASLSGSDGSAGRGMARACWRLVLGAVEVAELDVLDILN